MAMLARDGEHTIIHPTSFSDYGLAAFALGNMIENITLSEDQELHGYIEYLQEEKKWRPIVLIRKIS